MTAWNRDGSGWKSDWCLMLVFCLPGLHVSIPRQSEDGQTGPRRGPRVRAKKANFKMTRRRSRWGLNVAQRSWTCCVTARPKLGRRWSPTAAGARIRASQPWVMPSCHGHIFGQLDLSPQSSRSLHLHLHLSRTFTSLFLFPSQFFMGTL